MGALKLRNFEKGLQRQRNFSETIAYDRGGNITSLNRAGFGILNYTYNGNSNQLGSISGFKTGAYTYDANGNTKTDGSRGINLAYNYLNLPQSITGSQTITYTYDATGRKLRKQSGTQLTDYIDGIEYLNGQITQINTEDGRALKVGSSSYNYEYTLTDHLGNNRVTFDTYSTTPARKVGEEAYYPFGLNVHRQVNAGNKYLYNKKELQEELTMYDYGARFYDPVVGRWGVIDGKSELYFPTSPYVYALNQPTNAIDPNGHLVIFVAGQNGGNGGSRGYWQQTRLQGVRGEDRLEKVVTKDFAGAVMNHFKDQNDMYLDGANGGWSNTIGGMLFGASSIGGSNLSLSTRINLGREHSGVDIASMISHLKRDKNSGLITESIKVIAHSMGAAYAKGLITEIVNYAKEHPELCRGLSITEYDFAAFQQNRQSAIAGASLFQYDNKGDQVAGGIVGEMNDSHLAKEEGAEKRKVSPTGGHSIFDFMDRIKNLPEGSYQFINGDFVRQ